VRLLRVLESGVVTRVGGEQNIAIDVRVIAATNRDLRQMVSAGQFQEDLYYRLNVIPIHMPPLRERREDIPLLVEHFVRKHAQRAGKRIDGLEPGVLEALQSAEWPGNVRELENTIERAVVLSPGSRVGADVVRLLGVASTASPGLPSALLRANLDWAERETVRRALEASNGVKKDAAEAMGISQRALSYYLAKHRIE
jgi:DNA-binding NtrC family response regulator